MENNDKVKDIETIRYVITLKQIIIIGCFAFGSWASVEATFLVYVSNQDKRFTSIETKAESVTKSVEKQAGDIVDNTNDIKALQMHDARNDEILKNVQQMPILFGAARR